MLDSFLEGSSLHEMLEKKKLFLINHEILEGCPCTFPDRKVFDQVEKQATPMMGLL